MKKAFYIISVLLLIVAAYFAYTFKITGYFREIVNSPSSMIVGKIPIIGVEDIAISYEDAFLILSSDDRAARRDAKKAGLPNPTQGGLYFYDLVQESPEPKLISGFLDREFNPHGISMMRLDSGIHKLWVINHVDGSHTIETFMLYGDSLVLDQVITDEALISPNDITAMDENTFYVTNDHGSISKSGRMIEDYMGVRKANVVYYDGAGFRVVAEGIAYANGINIDKKRNHLYVTSPRDFLLLVYDILPDGQLTLREKVAAGSGLDNIEIDEQGDLWIGSHPNLMWFASYAAGKKSQSPSEVIKIDTQTPGKYLVESIYVENGENVSAASVAIPYNGQIYIGNVMDSHVLVIKQDGAGQ